MASGSLGSLVVSLAVDTAKFQGDLGKAAAVAERRMKNIRDTATRAFTALTVAATAAGAALVAAVGKSLKNADALLEMSQALGTTVESLSALTYASGLAGVSQEELAVAIKKLASTAVDASNGVAASAGAFKALDIEVSRADGSLKSVDELIGEIANAFSKAPDSITKTAIATDLFGKSGAKLIPLLNEGADGIDAMKQRAEDLGLVISTKTAKAADQFFDSLSDLKSIGTAFSNLLAAELAPALANLAKELSGAATGIDRLRGLAESGANIVRFFTSTFIVLGSAVDAAGKNIGAFAAAFDHFFAGKFSEAAQIIKDRVEDARKEAQTELDLVTALYSDTAAGVAEAAPKLGAELAAPVTEAAKLSKSELEKLEADLIRFARFQEEIATKIAAIDYSGKVQRSFSISPLRPVVAESEAAFLNQSLGDSAEENTRIINERMHEIIRSNIELRDRTVQVSDAFKEADNSAKGLMATIKDEFARQSFTTIRDLIYDFSKGADNFGKRMLDAIRMILANKATEQLFELFGSIGKGGAGGGFLSALASGIGSLFGGSGGKSGSFKGFAAKGMSLSPGEWAIAGEAGPEPVFGGSSGAQIVPFAKGAAQRSVHIQAPLSISVRVDGSTDRSITQQQIDRTVRGAIGEYNEFWRDQLSRGAYA